MSNALNKIIEKIIVKINDLISKFIEITQKYKGIYFEFENKMCYYIKFDQNFLSHAFGLSKLLFFKNMKPSHILEFVLKNKMKPFYFKNASKEILRQIKCKIESFENLINYFKNKVLLDSCCFNDIHFFYKGEFKTYTHGEMFSIGISCVDLKEHKFSNKRANNNYKSFSIQSIRHLQCYKNDNCILEENFNLKIKKIKLTKQKKNIFNINFYQLY